MSKRKHPRDHHYFFTRNLYAFIAQRTFSSISFFHLTDENREADLTEVDIQNDGMRLLKRIWYDAYVRFRPIEPDMEKIEFDGFSFFSEAINKDLIYVIITLPKPVAMAESYYFGIYYNIPDRKIKGDKYGISKIYPRTNFRFFTLEYYDEKHSALCEWQNERHHLLGLFDNISAAEFKKLIKLTIYCDKGK